MVNDTEALTNMLLDSYVKLTNMLVF